MNRKREYIKNRVVITGNRKGIIYERIRKQKEEEETDWFLIDIVRVVNSPLKTIVIIC